MNMALRVNMMLVPVNTAVHVKMILLMHLSLTCVLVVLFCPALVCDASDSQPHEARRRCILDFDMFHHLVALCLSLPALYADDDSDTRLLVATGRLNDLHALHLVFTAHLVQLLLTASVNLKSEGSPLCFFIVSFCTSLSGCGALCFHIVCHSFRSSFVGAILWEEM